MRTSDDLDSVNREFLRYAVVESSHKAANRLITHHWTDANELAKETDTKADKVAEKSRISGLFSFITKLLHSVAIRGILAIATGALGGSVAAAILADITNSVSMLVSFLGYTFEKGKETLIPSRQQIFSIVRIFCYSFVLASARNYITASANWLGEVWEGPRAARSVVENVLSKRENTFFAQVGGRPPDRIILRIAGPIAVVLLLFPALIVTIVVAVFLLGSVFGN